MRVLLVGWPSFLHGEATAGDVLSMRRIAEALASAGIAHDTVWSPKFAPGCLTLDRAWPQDYTHLVFACGPAHGWQVRDLHRRYARCRRLAVGVSVVDPDDPAVTGFHGIFARDGLTGPARDLACPPRRPDVPVVGVVLAPGQGEYSDRRRHDSVHRCLLDWLDHRDHAPLPLETRLDTGDWRLCSSPEQCAALFARVDVVVTSRLHGLLLALSQSVPALALDPVAGGGKVTAQAAAWRWPATVAAEQIQDGDADAFAVLDRWWGWCRSSEAHALARERTNGFGGTHHLVTALLDELEASPAAPEPA
ncbi:hypothetical protein FHX42_002192 [Saccharopolyspora lacisalsi]|uniref:Polysaccharide pyruvyl transferase domain-containing protein n=1 Tax=Halosaccharopolyspora lacisalsi TaxID=1000566 RepID=A0A839DZK7_9PSEU|nr:polysaccharide pyruvyl transferase family protein [Halosaccharopolyspora lacisalsi]MBA8824845.1 hypothetical protein [Halosaccharopolyspora lacisalsi]